MKKLFIAAMAAMLCVCFALPAVAEVTTGGMIWVDTYIRDINEEDAVDGLSAGSTTLHNGVEDLQINTPLDRTYVRFSYTNSKGNLGGHVFIFAGSINDADNTSEMNSQAYIWWKPMPNLTLNMGKVSQFIGGVAPNLPLGDAEYYRNINDTGVTNNQAAATQVPAGIAFGNLHTSSKPGFTAEYKINDMFSVNVGLFDPDYDGVDNDRFTFLSTRGAGTTALGEGVLPRLDISVPIKIGNFYIQPKAGWLRKEYDQVAAPRDDEFDIWVVGADASFKLGPVTLLAEYAYGENLGAGNFTGGLSTLGPSAYDTDGDGIAETIVDIETTMWFAEINWAITPKILAIANYGQLDWEDPGTSAANKLEIEDRSFWSVSFRYAIMPNFFVHPSYIRLDNGETTFGNFPTTDNGYTDYYGVSFYVLF